MWCVSSIVFFANSQKVCFVVALFEKAMFGLGDKLLKAHIAIGLFSLGQY